jgi:hypothetical protein
LILFLDWNLTDILLPASIIFLVENSDNLMLFCLQDISMTGSELMKSIERGENTINSMRGFVECLNSKEKPFRIFLPPFNKVSIMQ